MPKVSVLIPFYNSRDYVEETIESVLSQNFNDFELILVDNQSTDGSYELIQKYADDNRVKIFQNEVNIGMCGNWNQSLSYAKGEYIKYLFADDLLYPNALERYCDVLDENPNISLVTSYFDYFGSQNYTFKQPLTGKINGRIAIKESLISHNWIGAPSNVMFRRSCVKWEGFNVIWHWWLDFEFWHKLLLSHDLFVIPETLSKFRYHVASATTAAVGNFDNLNDEYFYLKSLQNNPEYFFLQNDIEFNKALKRNAEKWITHVSLFFQIKRYDLIKKSLSIVIEERLVKNFFTYFYRKALQKMK